jgi:hypothetical protein
MSEVTIQQKNVAIAEMLGAVKENWYPPNEQYGTTGDYYAFPQGQKSWYPDNVRHHGDYALKFHSDANWQFEALDWVERCGCGLSILSNPHTGLKGCHIYKDDRHCGIEVAGYESNDCTKKEAIFEALYQFSLYLKTKS